MTAIVVNGKMLGAVGPAGFSYRCNVCGWMRKHKVFKTEPEARGAFERHLEQAHPEVFREAFPGLAARGRTAQLA